MFAAVCVLLAATGHIVMSGTAVPWWAIAASLACTTAAAWALAGRERGLPVVTASVIAVQAALHACFSLVQAVVHPALPTGSSFARQWAEYLTCGEGATGALSSRNSLRVLTDTLPGGAASQPPPMPDMADMGAHVHHAAHTAHALHGTVDSAVDVTAGATAPVSAAAAAAAGAGLPGGHDMTGMSPSGILAAHLLAALLAGLWLAYGERAAFGLLRALAAWLRAPLRLLLGTTAAPHRPTPRVRRRRQVRAPRRLFLVHAITSRGPPTGTAVL
ncbi:hypothetical protein AMK16_03610 [Streptomyces sp. CB00455]|uniref:hypothetical protein n=1 Tax=Streptomyces sp. CB00455 TaxID=1703927 RepID=UPI00093D5C76|nr:hypothetical protein [Streptomyces sp. CB00455]OKK22265.1 hypothetical protein AMK16_03610 [Streptomyces sp. CB00455]